MKREKVLVAERSTFMRIMVTTALEKLGFEVLGTAKDGEDAVAKYMELKPDIVLVDIGLDSVDGIEVTRRIVQDDPAAVVIMLIMESTDIPDIIVEAVRAGAKGYIKKPLSEAEIEKRISGALGRS
jgi:two-component system chemotaxis response regulator CheY